MDFENKKRQGYSHSAAEASLWCWPHTDLQELPASSSAPPWASSPQPSVRFWVCSVRYDLSGLCTASVESWPPHWTVFGSESPWPGTNEGISVWYVTDPLNHKKFLKKTMFYVINTLNHEYFTGNSMPYDAVIWSPFPLNFRNSVPKILMRKAIIWHHPFTFICHVNHVWSLLILHTGKIIL